MHSLAQPVRDALPEHMSALVRECQRSLVGLRVRYRMHAAHAESQALASMQYVTLLAWSSLRSMLLCAKRVDCILQLACQARGSRI